MTSNPQLDSQDGTNPSGQHRRGDDGAHVSADPQSQGPDSLSSTTVPDAAVADATADPLSTINDAAAGSIWGSSAVSVFLAVVRAGCKHGSERGSM
jgi:hypothetical protein